MSNYYLEDGIVLRDFTMAEAEWMEADFAKEGSAEYDLKYEYCDPVPTAGIACKESENGFAPIEPREWTSAEILRYNAEMRRIIALPIEERGDADPNARPPLPWEAEDGELQSDAPDLFFILLDVRVGADERCASLCEIARSKKIRSVNAVVPSYARSAKESVYFYNNSVLELQGGDPIEERYAWRGADGNRYILARTRSQVLGSKT